MSPVLIVVVITVVVALAFDVLNGFHDAANSVATVVSTRVLSPRVAVLWAAVFNFVAFLIFGTRVAANIAKGIDPHVLSLGLIGAALVGAIVWDLLTWWWGLPTSSSHALLGGYAGAAVAKAGVSVIIASGWTKTLIFIVVAPFMGLVLGLSLMVAVLWIFKRMSPRQVDNVFRKLQLVSA